MEKLVKTMEILVKTVKAVRNAREMNQSHARNLNTFQSQSNCSKSVKLLKNDPNESLQLKEHAVLSCPEKRP